VVDNRQALLASRWLQVFHDRPRQVPTRPEDTQAPISHRCRNRGVSVPEVLSGLGDSLSVKANDNTAHLLIAVSNIEVDLKITLNTPLST
jgi:hypothetical protein